MLVGGSPMGTAGGVKTTTLAVLVMSIIANLRGKKDVEVYGRKIRSSYIRSAQVVVGMAVSVLLISVLGFLQLCRMHPLWMCCMSLLLQLEP